MLCNKCIVSSGNRIELCQDCLNPKPWKKFKVGDRVRQIQDHVLIKKIDIGIIDSINESAYEYPLCIEYENCSGKAQNLFVKGEKFYILSDGTDIELINSIKCQCGNPQNGFGQGHSTWCDLYKREFV